MALSSHAASAAGVPDDEIYFSFVKYNAPSPEARRTAAARLAAPAGDASISILQVVRNWDRLLEDTRRKLSQFIYISPWRPDGTREVRSVASNGCIEVLSETTGATMDSLHFRAIYNSSPSSEHYSTTSFVSSMLLEAENIWMKEVTQMGLPAPKTQDDGKIRIYFCDIIGAGGGVVGRTWAMEPKLSDLSIKTYIEMDNDYSGISLPPDTTPLQYAGLTFAHEFFHAIQWGINYDAPSIWLLETNATWMEEETYPDINDYVYSYLDTRFDYSDRSLDDITTSNLLPYGSSLFFRHITENELNPSFVVDFWAQLKTSCAPPSTIAWCDWQVTEWPLLESTLQENSSSFQTVFRNYAVSNYTKNYHDGNLSAFPDVPVTSVTLSDGKATKTGTLPHAATHYYSLVYSAGGLDKIKLSFSGAAAAQWQVSAIQDDGAGGFTTNHMTISSGTGVLNISGFGVSYSKIVVAVSNSDTSLDNQSYDLDFQQQSVNTVTLISGTATVNGTLTPETTDYYETNYSAGGGNTMKITFSGASSAYWQVSVLCSGGTGGDTTKNIGIYSGAGYIIISDFGTLFSRLTVAVAYASAPAAAQAFSITFNEMDAVPVTGGNTYSTGWRLVGTPLEMLDSSSPAAALGIPHVTFFQLKNGAYSVDNPDPPLPGRAYWAYFSSSTTVSVMGLPPSSGDVPLQAGWNLVSPPFDTAATWGPAISVTDGASSFNVGQGSSILINDTIFTYDNSDASFGDGHTPEDGFAIQPWTGFAIYAKQACSLVFPAP